MVCVYGKIFAVVKKQVLSIQPLMYGLEGTPGAISLSSIKAAKKLCIICSAYFITYFPLFLKSVTVISFPAWYIFISHWLYLYSGVVNAFLYIVLNRSVRNEMKRTFFFWKEHLRGLTNHHQVIRGTFLRPNTPYTRTNIFVKKVRFIDWLIDWFVGYSFIQQQDIVSNTKKQVGLYTLNKCSLEYLFIQLWIKLYIDVC